MLISWPDFFVFYIALLIEGVGVVTGNKVLGSSALEAFIVFFWSNVDTLLPIPQTSCFTLWSCPRGRRPPLPPTSQMA